MGTSSRTRRMLTTTTACEGCCGSEAMARSQQAGVGATQQPAAGAALASATGCSACLTSAVPQRGGSSLREGTTWRQSSSTPRRRDLGPQWKTFLI